MAALIPSPAREESEALRWIQCVSENLYHSVNELQRRDWLQVKSPPPTVFVIG